MPDRSSKKHSPDQEASAAIVGERRSVPSPLPLPLSGGRVLIVDANNPDCYPRPSAALKNASANDQIYIQPGIYEDKIFLMNMPVRLIGAGRDLVQIFSRRGGPLYL